MNHPSASRLHRLGFGEKGRSRFLHRLDSLEVLTSMAMVLAAMASMILEKDPSTDSIKDVVDDLIEDLSGILRQIAR